MNHGGQWGGGIQRRNTSVWKKKRQKKTDWEQQRKLRTSAPYCRAEEADSLQFEKDKTETVNCHLLRLMPCYSKVETPRPKHRPLSPSQTGRRREMWGATLPDLSSLWPPRLVIMSFYFFFFFFFSSVLSSNRGDEPEAAESLRPESATSSRPTDPCASRYYRIKSWIISKVQRRGLDVWFLLCFCFEVTCLSNVSHPETSLFLTIKFNVAADKCYFFF